MTWQRAPVPISRGKRPPARMELRSGALIASGTGFTSAEQARAACLGQARVQLAPAHRPAFDAAVRGVLRRWTALRLAVENGWAGDDSAAAAEELEQSIIGWFTAKGATAWPRRARARGRLTRTACAQATTTQTSWRSTSTTSWLTCFTSRRRTAARQRRAVRCTLAALRRLRARAPHVTPRRRATRAAQVANLLVHVFEACAGGDYALATQLAAPPTLTALEQSQRDLSDKRWTLQHAAGRDPAAPSGAGGAGGAAAGGAAGVSPDQLADALGGMGSIDGADAPMAADEEPLEDGWERAPARRSRRAPRAAAA